jgi:hypothetical protein
MYIVHWPLNKNLETRPIDWYHFYTPSISLDSYFKIAVQYHLFFSKTELGLGKFYVLIKLISA